VRGALEVRALGPLAVFVAGQPIELGKGNERALIALLVLHPGRPVSSDAIIDALWGERPPPTAREMVRNYVARARKRLGEEAIETDPTGYRLVVDVEAVDLLVFERLAKDGARALEAGEADAARAAFDIALGLWRGRPLPELDFTTIGRDEIGRLEDLHLRVIEERTEAELSLGRSGELVPELEQLVREHPHRERLLGQLMRALYRSGRQKDALDRYQTGRRRLIEEAGLEPGPDLQQLQRSILRHAPELDPPQPDLGGAPPPARRSRAQRRLVIATGAATLLAAAVALPLALLDQNSGAITLSNRSIAALDPHTGTPVRQVQLARSPGPIAIAASVVWVGIGSPAAAVELDPNTLRVIKTITLTAAPYQLAAESRSLWTSNAFDGTLTRINNGGQASRPFRPAPHASGRLPLAYGDGSIWVGSQNNTIIRLSPNKRTIAIVHGVFTPEAIAIARGGVWITEATRDLVIRIDPRTNRVVHQIPIGGRGTDIATGAGAIWALTADRLWRINPRIDAVTASIDVGANAAHVVAIDSTIWIASPTGLLSRVNPRTNQVEKTVSLAKPISDLAAGDGRLWITLR
jgi:DNA-binding SARP family transcriptional activator/streptogramin lyase